MDPENILNALKNGNVPPEGVSEICVGRENEIEEFQKIFERVRGGVAVTKFLNGEFGAGKSFFLKLIEEKALAENFVVSKVTLSRDVPFNKFEVVYRNIARSLTCKTGISLEHIIERWMTKIRTVALRETIDPSQQEQIVRDNIHNDLKEAHKYSASFATAIENYYNLLSKGDHETAKHAIAWLSGETNIPFTIKRKFGVKGDIDKENAFKHLESLSAFLKSLNYAGLVILIDEAEHIMTLHNKKLRDTAYDYMRNIYDACNGGRFRNTLFIFAGTPEFFEDQKLGIPSYTALNERIEDVLHTELKDLRKPIIKLDGFKREDLMELSSRLISMHEELYDWDAGIVRDSLEGIISRHESSAELTGYIPPRIFVKSFISVLDVVQQNPELKTEDEILDLFEEKEEIELEDEDWI
ncbi:BREX system ATP-binding domain-containing protein [Methanothermobacter wolfeii]|uniref:ATP-binding protein n=1 Tax=Methanothermobacter wolfeii TaxID=145261 RepID=A0A9E7UHM7_METWO|nr:MULTISPECIES: BREX system ATP-binding domain-containing protein [Methanothermobacter]NLM01820.1 DUF2791 family P-loop domain-containing protein [Methanothermobacter wolfeii]QHN06203.1 hypothetical protein FZP57_03400 [Methanothermobacter sp. THM-1]UXH32404.1 ATP-binding protein [Methanothermobacter wolfeii]SCM56799.1 putative protein {ECO:0000313/EMBL:ADL58345,1} [Methanothermobacter wolfeii]